MEWDAFVVTAADAGYDRSLTIERFGFTLGAMLAAAANWRDLASTPATSAFEGVGFAVTSVVRVAGPAVCARRSGSFEVLNQHQVGPTTDQPAIENRLAIW